MEEVMAERELLYNKINIISRMLEFQIENKHIIKIILKSINIDQIELK